MLAWMRGHHPSSMPTPSLCLLNRSFRRLCDGRRRAWDSSTTQSAGCVDSTCRSTDPGLNDPEPLTCSSPPQKGVGVRAHQSKFGARLERTGMFPENDLPRSLESDDQQTRCRAVHNRLVSFGDSLSARRLDPASPEQSPFNLPNSIVWSAAMLGCSGAEALSRGAAL